MIFKNTLRKKIIIFYFFVFLMFFFAVGAVKAECTGADGNCCDTLGCTGADGDCCDTLLADYGLVCNDRQDVCEYCGGTWCECTVDETESCTVDEGEYAQEKTCGDDCIWGSCTATEWCGDGTVNGPEDCEPDETESCTVDEGEYAQEKTCGDDCTWGSCTVTESCGDGTVNGPEDCEGSGSTSCDINGYTGSKSCSSCTWGSCVPTIWCGDGTINNSEDCDSDNSSATNCTSGGYAGKYLCSYCSWDTATDTASCPSPYKSFNNTNCKWDTNCTPIDWCGDDTLQSSSTNPSGPEECEVKSSITTDPSPNPGECIDTYGYDGTYLCNGCSWDTSTDSVSCTYPNTGSCRWDASCTPTDWCGDGTVNGPENCEITSWNTTDPVPSDCSAPTASGYAEKNLCGGCAWDLSLDKMQCGTVGCEGLDCGGCTWTSDTATDRSEKWNLKAGTMNCTGGFDCLTENCVPVDWCGDGKLNGPEECDAISSTATDPDPWTDTDNECTLDNYNGLHLCEGCDLNRSTLDVDTGKIDMECGGCTWTPTLPGSKIVKWKATEGTMSCDGNIGCTWETDCTPIEWCGDERFQEDAEECDATSSTTVDPAVNSDDLGSEDLDPEACSTADGYRGTNLCDGCDWNLSTDNMECGGCTWTPTLPGSKIVKWKATEGTMSCDGNIGCTWETDCTPVDWCGDGKLQSSSTTPSGPEECDATSSTTVDPAVNSDDLGSEDLDPEACSTADGYRGTNLCDGCDWNLSTDNMECGGCTWTSTLPGSRLVKWKATEGTMSCDGNIGCTWETDCTPVDWCGDGKLQSSSTTPSGPEECDATSSTATDPDPWTYDDPTTPELNDGKCEDKNYHGQAGDGYEGLFLCDGCTWDLSTDNMQCGGCDWNWTIPNDDWNLAGSGSVECDGKFNCTWETEGGEETYGGKEGCTSVDWCGDGIINGPELYCDSGSQYAPHDPKSDFGGESCASKICGDINSPDVCADPNPPGPPGICNDIDNIIAAGGVSVCNDDPSTAGCHDVDKSSYSKAPGCSSLVGGDLTCSSVCRFIYTLPNCEFPLNATGIDLSDDGEYLYVTDADLWSLQVFAVDDLTAPSRYSSTQGKIKAIYYFDSEPLSVDVSGNYAYVGTKEKLEVIDIRQLNQSDRFPDSIAPVFPSKPKDNPFEYPFREEQPLPIISVDTLGEVNDVYISGAYAYLAIGTAGSVGPAALEVIDISGVDVFDSSSISSVGSYQYANTLTGAQSVDVFGNYAYLSYADGSDNKGYLDVFNISVPSNPLPFKSIEISNTTSSVDISEDGNYAYVDGFSTFHSVNVTTPSVPSTLWEIDNLNFGKETFDIDAWGSSAYTSVKDIGIWAVDVSTPGDIFFDFDKIFTAPNDAPIPADVVSPVIPVLTDIIINDNDGDTVEDRAYAAAGDDGLLVFDLTANCGNGVKDGFEVCDGDDLGGETCATIGLGFTEGSLSCKLFCNAFDTSDCSNPEGVCAGVPCFSPGPCEMNPGTCKDINGAPVCVYPDNPNACGPPGYCQVGKGKCDKSDGKCHYSNDPKFCDYEGSIGLPSNVCTGDTCVSKDGGLTSVCTPGPNICGGLVPCGRLVDNPATDWVETEPCSFHTLMIMGKLVIEFLVKIAAAATLIAIAIGGLLYVFAIGKQETFEKAKSIIKYAILGLIIIFIAWAITDLILAVLGYLDPQGGKWYITD